MGAHGGCAVQFSAASGENHVLSRVPHRRPEKALLQNPTRTLAFLGGKQRSRCYFGLSVARACKILAGPHYSLSGLVVAIIVKPALRYERCNHQSECFAASAPAYNALQQLNFRPNLFQSLQTLRIPGSLQTEHPMTPFIFIDSDL